MKKLMALMATGAFCFLSKAAETEHFIARIAPTSSPERIVGSADVRLTGTNVLILVEFPTITFNLASVNGPAAPGSDGPAFLRYENEIGCPADSSCGFLVETNLTELQAATIRAGLAYVLVDDVYRGQIVPNELCVSPGTNSIHLEATLRGRVSFENRAVVVWGKAAFILSGHLLGYRIDFPAIQGPYFGTFSEEGIHTPIGGGRVLLLGTLNCGPTATNLPPAMGGFDSFPRCIWEGTICLPDDVLPALLAGNWLVSFHHPLGGQNIFGNIFPLDSDGDNVPDYLDACANTPPGAVINADGCSIEQLCPCDGPWKNHGEFVNCIKQVTADFLKAGLITSAERRTRIQQAITSDCGKRP